MCGQNKSLELNPIQIVSLNAGYIWDLSCVWTGSRHADVCVWSVLRERRLWVCWRFMLLNGSLIPFQLSDGKPLSVGASDQPLNLSRSHTEIESQTQSDNPADQPAPEIRYTNSE